MTPDPPLDIDAFDDKRALVEAARREACGDLDLALSLTDRVLQRSPNLTAALRQKRRLTTDSAQAAILDARLRNAEIEDTRDAAQRLVWSDRVDAAERILIKLAKDFPDDPRGSRYLGWLEEQRERPEKACDHYRRALEIDPEDERSRVRLAVLGAAPPPARIPDTVIQGLYHAYGHQYDEDMERIFQYQAPQLLFAAVSAALAGRLDSLRMLDIGCGTGLNGALFRGAVGRLDGVDLSESMLEAARARDVYDELIQGEIVATLNTRPKTYDVIAGSGVLIYFGPLDEIFQSARVALRPDGLLAFTLEEGEHDGYQLESYGRFTHGRSYVEQVAERHGFDILSLTSAPELWMEDGQPVPALTGVFRDAAP